MPRPNKGMRVRGVRFTDEEWAEVLKGAAALGETRSEAVRAGALSRVRQAIPDAADVTVALVAAAQQVAQLGGMPDRAWHNGVEYRACVYCHRFTDMQDSLPVKGGGSAHASCAFRQSIAAGGVK